MFGTVDHATHRMRRAPLNKLFSKAQISKLEPKIQGLAQRLCDKLLALQGSGRVFDLTSAYSCYTTDVVYQYCFGASIDLLGKDGFEPNFRTPIMGFLNQLNFTKFFPFVLELIQSTPL